MASLKTKLTVAIYKEGDHFIAHCPSVDLCTQGKSVNDAKKNFDEAWGLFLEEVVSRKGALEQVLLDCGWKKTAKSWLPPQFITNIEEEVAIPL